MSSSVAVLGPESWAEGVLQRVVGGGGGGGGTREVRGGRKTGVRGMERERKKRGRRRRRKRKKWLVLVSGEKAIGNFSVL